MFQLNDRPLAIESAPGRYATIERQWKKGDRLVVTIPMVVRTEALRGAPDTIAFLYGPVVLAGDLGPAPRSDTVPYAKDQAANLKECPGSGRNYSMSIAILVSDRISVRNFLMRRAFHLQVRQVRSLTMVSKVTTAFLIAVIAGGMTACSTTDERGSMESAGANAGRVMDDTAITAKVKTALIQDSDTKAHQIQVETFQGTVQLSGFVDDAEASTKATQIARNVEGVKDVKNSLQVRGGG